VIHKIFEYTINSIVDHEAIVDKKKKLFKKNGNEKI